MGLGQGKFRAPTLRNIALTAPYMHDGRFGTLAEVLEHYVRGGGSEGGQEKSPILRPLSLKESEKSDLLAFLESLSDMEMTLDPRWSNPWVDR
jgi:cytochrome c peroxidase